MTTRPWHGGDIDYGISAVLAPNPSPMTLEGTNTYVLEGIDGGEAIVVDPGPAGLPDHLSAIVTRAGDVGLTLLTHHHRDHTEAVTSGEWAVHTPAPVRGGGVGQEFVDGERIELAGRDLLVVHTPGHTADSVSLLVEDTGVLLSGDTVLGRGSSVVPWPQGDLGDYLRSLDRLIELTEAGRIQRIAPGHGPVITEPLAALRRLRSHRLRRLDELRQVLADGVRDPAQIVATIYGDLPRLLTWAATATVRAQLAYLGEDVGEDAPSPQH